MIDAYLQHELWKWNLLMHFITNPLLWLAIVLLAAFGLYHLRTRPETRLERQHRLDRDIDTLVARHPELSRLIGWRDDNGRWHITKAPRIEPQDDEGRD